MKKVLLFFAKLGKKPIKIAFRPYLFEKGTVVYSLNSILALFGFKITRPSVDELANLAHYLGRDLLVYTWVRDEYGSSDGAHFAPTGIVIKSSIKQNLAELKEELNDKLSGWMLFSILDGSEQKIPVVT